MTKAERLTVSANEQLEDLELTRVGRKHLQRIARGNYRSSPKWLRDALNNTERGYGNA